MAFGACGIEAIVEGEVNDYCGKGLSGAIVVVQSPQNRGFKAETAVVCGNVALYGATSGQLFVQGRAGERFAVRNSGAEAVVEAVGNHACEYMTGGVVLVLGTTGTNFAAGMTGGVAYVLDWEGDFSRKANLAYVSLDPIGVRDFDAVLRLLKDHAHYTGSLTADFLLRHFDSHRGKIIRVCPIDAGAQTVPGPRVTLKARPDRRLIARTVRGLLREELNG
jgi:glutamate synthase domain-containing protein 3